jgi:hypothetical protein
MGPPQVTLAAVNSHQLEDAYVQSVSYGNYGFPGERLHKASVDQS